MAGTVVTPVTKTRAYTRTVTYYWVGSFWPGAGKPASEIVSRQTTNVPHSWEDIVSTGENIPNWRELIRLGYNATTDLVGGKHILNFDSSDAYQYREVVGPGLSTEYHIVTDWTGCILAPPAHAGGYTSDEVVLNLAAQEFYKKARRAQTQLQAGVIAGEAAQTIRGVLQTVRTIRGGITHYLNSIRKPPRKRGRRLSEYSRKEITQFLSDQWLSVAYGWKPLLSDLDDSMKYLATDPEVLSDDVKIKAEAEVVARGTSGVVQGAQIEASVSSEERVTATYRGKVSRKVSGFALAGDAMSARAGLDPSNWLPTIWELIPYSFIVDYFSNVQEVISAYTFNQQSILWVNRTIRREVITRLVNPHPIGQPVGATTEILTLGNTTFTYSSVDRKSDEGPGNVSLTLQTPDWITTESKWLNMAALLAKSKGMTPYVW